VTPNGLVRRCHANRHSESAVSEKMIVGSVRMRIAGVVQTRHSAGKPLSSRTISALSGRITHSRGPAVTALPIKNRGNSTRYCSLWRLETADSHCKHGVEFDGDSVLTNGRCRWQCSSINSDSRQCFCRW
jgi:hypothetical protein